MSNHSLKFREDLSKVPFQKVESLLLYLIAIANLLDTLTTYIGFQVGLVESVPISIAALNAYGLWGLIYLKGGIALIAVLLDFVFRPQLKKLGPIANFAFVMLFVGALMVFTIPVASNILLILQRAG